METLLGVLIDLELNFENQRKISALGHIATFTTLEKRQDVVQGIY